MTRILMVCRHFPPAISGGAGRPYLLAKAWRDAGAEVVVLAPRPCDGIAVIPVGHPQVEPPTAEPVSAPSWRDRLRAGLLLPDPDIRWALHAARATIGLAPDWVFTTSPPESAHVAGWLLKRRFGCRWMADFRDHWLRHPLLPARSRSGLRRNMERGLARRLLRAVDLATAVTESIGDELRRDLGVTAATLVVENFAAEAAEAMALPKDRIHLVHTGSFSLSDPLRRIEPLLEAFEAADNPRLTLHLVGRLRDDERRRVESSPIKDRIVVAGPVSAEAARRYQRAADVLLLVTSPDTPHVPGKLAEYRAAGRPVLVAGGGPWLGEAGLDAGPDLRRAFAAMPEVMPVAPGIRLTPAEAVARIGSAMLSSEGGLGGE